MVAVLELADVVFVSFVYPSITIATNWFPCLVFDSAPKTSIPTKSNGPIDSIISNGSCFLPCHQLLAYER